MSRQFLLGIADKIERLATMFTQTEVEQLREIANPWQDLSTAPEKTPVLVFIPDAKHRKDRIQVGSWAASATSKPLWIVGNNFLFDIGTATKWMHIPEEPE